MLCRSVFCLVTPFSPFDGGSMAILQKLWQGWKRIGQFLGDILARVVLTLFYFSVFAPFGLGVTLFSDPLRTRKTVSRAWLSRDSQNAEPSLEEAGRQF
jgi:hypothetical protein